MRLKGGVTTAFEPRLFEALHVYSPVSLSAIPTINNTLVKVSLMFSRTPVSMVFSVSSNFFVLSVLIKVLSLNQEMEGVGTPSAEHIKLTRLPVTTVSSRPVELMYGAAAV